MSSPVGSASAFFLKKKKQGRLFIQFSPFLSVAQVTSVLSPNKPWHALSVGPTCAQARGSGPDTDSRQRHGLVQKHPGRVESGMVDLQRCQRAKKILVVSKVSEEARDQQKMNGKRGEDDGKRYKCGQP